MIRSGAVVPPPPLRRRPKRRFRCPEHYPSPSQLPLLLVRGRRPRFTVLLFLIWGFWLWNHQQPTSKNNGSLVMEWSVASLRIIAPWFLWDRWNCHRPVPIESSMPLNRHGRPSNRFGVLLLFVPEGGKMTDKQREMWQIAERNRIQYCQRHGYIFLNGTSWSEQHDQKQNMIHHQLQNRTHMLKSIALLDILEKSSSTATTTTTTTTATFTKNYNNDHDSRQQQQQALVSYPFQYPKEELDWILFLDTDVMILNMDVSIPTMIANVQPNEGMVLSTEADRVNTGALVVANTVAGRAILQAWSTGAYTKQWDSDQWYFYTLFQQQQQQQYQKEDRHRSKLHKINKDNKQLRMKQRRQQYSPSTTPYLITDKTYPGGVRIETSITSIEESLSTSKDKNPATNQLKVPPSSNGATTTTINNKITNITYKIVPPCMLQSCGGLEYSTTRGRPYFEGLYSRGDFAVHFFGKRDKLSLMRLADRGSLGFWS